ncbi:NADH dehydrogenase [ubiquinone] iron-sulfur protein 6, mitochondrial-like [Gigantopelta aegis]|uniref:NADH dehydrogenase [ubiquinone] iron-sulfur protein 6, mitochondrial-like n=1 Tax=Gigantopelta aegis TaxID=1735272 RepID=UPI001B88A016|nr:NADH dehydrogenase [ubiquinone] iron-sulfur protein 6, mitochondrial-like [Gigantopelta aegis]
MTALVRAGLRVCKQGSATRLFCSTSFNCVQEGPNVDLPTHTGQVWDKSDYRRVRFLDKDKQINKNFAIQLVAEEPVVIVNARSVWSDGGGPLGHPKVFINLDRPEIGVCGYSGRKFIQKKYYDASRHGPSITYDEYLAEERHT